MDNIVEQVTGDLSRIDKFREEHHTSVLSLMFTDIVGFTSITEYLGDEKANQIRRTHDRIIKDIIEQNNQGLLVKTLGDGTFCVFNEPSVAVERALQIQKEIPKIQDSNDVTIAVRIGLHLGQVTIENQTNIDVFGRHVNKCQRISSLGDAQSILLSYPMYDSSFGWVKGDSYNSIQWKNLGKFSLKGFQESEQVYAVYDKSQEPNQFIQSNKFKNKDYGSIKYIESFKIRQSTLRIYIGSITDLDKSIDVLVSSDDDHLRMSGGVAYAIRKKAGDSIKKEAHRQGPRVLGDVIKTSGGRLACNYIFHAITLGLSPVQYPNNKIIKKITSEVLKNLKELNFSSVAFPLFGTGAGKFPLEKGLDVMTKQILHFLWVHRKTYTIVLVLNQPDKIAASIRKMILNNRSQLSGLFTWIKYRIKFFH